jgi:hypothetical protein
MLRADELTPAYLGLIDFVRLTYGLFNLNPFDVNTSADPAKSMRRVTKPRNCVLENFAQTNDVWKGRYVGGADNWFVQDPGVKHTDMPRYGDVIHKITVHAANAYLKRVLGQIRNHPEMHGGAGGILVHETDHW